MKTAIQDWLGTDATRLPDSIRGDCLNIVQYELLSHNELSFGEFSDTFSTVVATRGYVLPTGWVQPHTLWYINPDTTSVVFLRYLDKERFDLNFPDSAKTGKPSAYTVWGQQIQLGKTPDVVVTVNRNYFRTLADLADGAPNNENDLTKNAWQVLLYGGLKESERFGIEDARLPQWTARYNELKDALVTQHARARTSGRRPQSREPS